MLKQDSQHILPDIWARHNFISGNQKILACALTDTVTTLFKFLQTLAKILCHPFSSFLLLLVSLTCLNSFSSIVRAWISARKVAICLLALSWFTTTFENKTIKHFITISRMPQQTTYLKKIFTLYGTPRLFKKEMVSLSLCLRS